MPAVSRITRLAQETSSHCVKTVPRVNLGRASSWPPEPCITGGVTLATKSRSPQSQTTRASQGVGVPVPGTCGHNEPVATASTTIPASRLHGHHDRPSMVSVGTIIWLSSELMFFAALFASYFTIRAVSPELWAQSTEKLDVPFASVNTTILVLSSFTCQMGVFAAEAGRVGRSGALANFRAWGLREWFVLTYIMGAIFIGGQAFEYTQLVHEGITIPASGYGTMFYLATGF